MLNLGRRHLDIEQRRELVQKLRDEGLSVRWISDKTGIPKSTVQRDTQRVPHGIPEYVVGTDGKRYPSVHSTVPADLADLINRRWSYVALALADVSAVPRMLAEFDDDVLDDLITITQAISDDRSAALYFKAEVKRQIERVRAATDVPADSASVVHDPRPTYLVPCLHGTPNHAQRRAGCEDFLYRIKRGQPAGGPGGPSSAGQVRFSYLGSEVVEAHSRRLPVHPDHRISVLQ